MATSPFLPQPPRMGRDQQSDQRALIDWTWKFFQALAVDNEVLVRATEYADPGVFDSANLPTPTGTTVAQAQLTANNAYLLAALIFGNLRAGSLTIADANTTGTVTFATAMADTTYRVVAMRTGVVGSPAASSDAVASVTKTAAGFTLTVKAAPGAGTSVSFDWVAIR